MDSLPALEAVPSPAHQTVSVLSSSGSIAPAAPTTTVTASTSTVPTLHNELPRSFSGDILHTLEHLGVSAYSTADVEQTVIARAMQVEAGGQRRASKPNKQHCTDATDSPLTQPNRSNASASQRKSEPPSRPPLCRSSAYCYHIRQWCMRTTRSQQPAH